MFGTVSDDILVNTIPLPSGCLVQPPRKSKKWFEQRYEPFLRIAMVTAINHFFVDEALDHGRFWHTNRVL